jgi:hypothetical protein
MTTFKGPVWLVELAYFWPVIVFILGLIAWGLRREWRRLQADLVERIEQRTKPIQPGTNGGKSLSDLHKKVDMVIASNRVLRNDLQEHIRAHDQP